MTEEKYSSTGSIDPESKARIEGVIGELEHIADQLNIAVMAISSLYDAKTNQPIEAPEGVRRYVGLMRAMQRLAGEVTEQLNELQTLPAMPIR